MTLLITAILDIVFLVCMDCIWMTIRISGSAKQKVKEVHSKISSFWRSSDNSRSDKPETFYALSHNLNGYTINCQKDLACSTSKNSMIMSNFSAKENHRGIQDKSQKYENFTDFLFNIRKHHYNKITMAHININSLRNKFGILTNSVSEYIDVLMISETWRHISACFVSSKGLLKSMQIRQKFSWRWNLGLRKR